MLVSIQRSLHSTLDILVFSKPGADRSCVIVYYKLTHPLVTVCYFACQLVHVETVESKLFFSVILKSLGTRLLRVTSVIINYYYKQTFVIQVPVVKVF